MNRAMSPVKPRTTAVDPISSSRVDHDTLESSPLTSVRKLPIFLSIFSSLRHGRSFTGAEGLEPPGRDLESRRLPLTDAPNFTRTKSPCSGLLFYFFMRRVLATEPAVLIRFKLVRMLLLVFQSRIISVFADGAL